MDTKLTRWSLYIAVAQSVFALEYLIMYVVYIVDKIVNHLCTLLSDIKLIILVFQNVRV